MDAIEEVRAARVMLSGAASARLRSSTDSDLCVLLIEVEAAGRLIDALRTTIAAEVGERSRPELGSAGLSERLGHRQPAHLLEQHARISNAEARRRLHLGRAVKDRFALNGAELPPRYPLVAAALRRGAIGTEAAARIVGALNQAETTADPAGLTRAEEALVEAAGEESADLVTVRARVWREYLDPDGAEPRDDARWQKRAFTLGRERDGLTPCSGTLEPVFAALLRSALAEHPGAVPRFLSESDLESGGQAESIRDDRTRAQRNHDVIAGLVTAGVRTTASATGGQAPLSMVTAVVKLTDLEADTGVGWLDDGEEPVASSTTRLLACDSGYRRVVLGDNGEVLHLGHRERYFTAHQRRALAVRDGGCVWPHCTAPPSWCDAHHVVEWKHGGRTDIDNGALLCRAHHHMLHRSEYVLRMSGGRPQLLAPPWLDPHQRWRTLGRARVLRDTG